MIGKILKKIIFLYRYIIVKNINMYVYTNYFKVEIVNVFLMVNNLFFESLINSIENNLI